MKTLAEAEVNSWIKDSRIAQLLIEAVDTELERVYEESSETFVSGNPNMTHERKAVLVGRENELTILKSFLLGNYELYFSNENGFTILQEKKDDEQQHEAEF